MQYQFGSQKKNFSETLGCRAGKSCPHFYAYDVEFLLVGELSWKKIRW